MAVYSIITLQATPAVEVYLGCGVMCKTPPIIRTCGDGLRLVKYQLIVVNTYTFLIAQTYFGDADPLI